MIWVKCADKGLESISFWNMSAAAGIGATSISTIEGTLRSSRFYDSKYPLKINWIMATQLENDKDSGLNWRLMLIENVSCDCIKRVTLQICWCIMLETEHVLFLYSLFRWNFIFATSLICCSYIRVVVSFYYVFSIW